MLLGLVELPSVLVCRQGEAFEAAHMPVLLMPILMSIEQSHLLRPVLSVFDEFGRSVVRGSNNCTQTVEDGRELAKICPPLQTVHNREEDWPSFHSADLSLKLGSPGRTVKHG